VTFCHSTPTEFLRIHRIAEFVGNYAFPGNKSTKAARRSKQAILKRVVRVITDFAGEITHRDDEYVEALTRGLLGEAANGLTLRTRLRLPASEPEKGERAASRTAAAQRSRPYRRMSMCMGASPYFCARNS